MIEPTETDLGRRVIYVAHKGAEPERGELWSLQHPEGPRPQHHVFVKYEGWGTPMLTPCQKLEWEHPR